MKNYKIIILAVIVLAVFVFLIIGRTNSEPKLLESSPPDTVALKWDFYPCGNDCPYYRVLSTASDENKKYLDEMTAIHGYDPNAAFENLPGKERLESIYTLMWADKLVCRGQFKKFTRPRRWECCMGDVDNLVFAAETCERVRMSVAEVYGRDLASIEKAAEQGEAEAQYDLGRIYEGGLWLPKNKPAAERWYGLAAAQNHEDAESALEMLQWEDKQVDGTAEEE